MPVKRKSAVQRQGEVHLATLPTWLQALLPSDTDVMPTVGMAGRGGKKLMDLERSVLAPFISHDPTMVPRGDPKVDDIVRWLLENEKVPDPKWWKGKR